MRRVRRPSYLSIRFNSFLSSSLALPPQQSNHGRAASQHSGAQHPLLHPRATIPRQHSPLPLPLLTNALHTPAHPQHDIPKPHLGSPPCACAPAPTGTPQTSTSSTSALPPSAARLRHNHRSHGRARRGAASRLKTQGFGKTHNERESKKRVDFRHSRNQKIGNPSSSRTWGGKPALLRCGWSRAEGGVY